VNRTTNRNPSYRIQIAKQQDAGTLYAVNKQKIENRIASSDAKCYAGVNLGMSEITKVMTPTDILSDYPSSDSGLSDLALTRLKRKLSKRVGGAEALVPVVEAKELHGLFRQATTMTTTLVTTLIDIKRTKGTSALKYASTAWLAYGFGIRPLVDDIGNVIDAIGNYFNRANTGIRESASAKRDWFTASTPSNTVTLCAGPQCWQHTVYHHELSYRWYCGGSAVVSSANDYTLAKHLGFDFQRDLIPAFWELIPYSWVVDYFVTVGDFIDDLFQVLPGTMYYAGFTKRYKCKMYTTLTWKVPRNWTASVTNGESTGERFEFQRVPTGTILPHIGLRIRSMDEIGKFGVGKLLNLASVFIQRKVK